MNKTGMRKMEVRRGRQTPRNQESFYRLSPQQMKTPSPKEVFKEAPSLEARPGHVGGWTHTGLLLASPILSPPIANIWSTIMGKQTKEVASVRRQGKHSPRSCLLSPNHRLPTGLQEKEFLSGR